MRYVFFIIIIALLELFSLGAALSLQWLLQPWLTSSMTTAVWVLIFVITNSLLAVTFSKRFDNSYRWMSGWLLVMHFMLLTALIVSLLYGSYGFIHSFADVAILNTVSVSAALRILALVIFVGLFIYSLYCAYVPVVRRLSITINKPLASSLRIAMASDLHLGQLFGNKAIDKLHQLIVENKADILLMPGDIMDDNIKAYTAHNMAAKLTELCSSLPYGVYATLGNHDLYGHEQPISKALQEAGVQLLNDEVFKLEYAGETIWLIGRFDNHKRERVATTDLLQQVDASKSVILLDHRPSDIEQHSELPIDLQVSGHTHDGQIFPANFIVRAINRLGYGYKAIGRGHFVVSSGYGFWGIPFRLGSRSEIWLIEMTGQPVVQALTKRPITIQR
ncbi:metallophosphoesterase [Psychrobacter sp. 2Y5]|uniref:metallophosphoesterase n=1 Tax=unclassified Psychrobacter TaxID=196806 RepID=UPI003F446B17